MLPRKQGYLRDLQHNVIIEGDEEEDIHYGTELSPDSPAILVPLEFEEGVIEEDTFPLFDWSHPWYPIAFISLYVGFPVVTSLIFVFYNLFGRIWVTLGFCLHLFVLSVHTWTRIHAPATSPTTPSSSSCTKWVHGLFLSIDIVVFGAVYPIVIAGVNEAFFIEPDGTYVLEWTRHLHILQICRILSIMSSVYLSIVTVLSVGSRRWRLLALAKSKWQGSYPLEIRSRKQIRYQRISSIAFLISGMLLLWALVSTLVHVPSWQGKTLEHPDCDPLDTHECILPFPSMHHLKEDNTTETGYRVNLRGHLMPRMKGGIEMHPAFLNELDGFSTMGPILFYMDRLREAHEAGKHQLRGHPDIEFSTAQGSVTLLLRIDLDTKEGVLVEHSAEIDYLDSKNPLVMVFPARPLHHNARYALAVVGAVDENGDLLPRARGFVDLLHDKSSTKSQHYIDILLPSLMKAAPWIKSKSDVQLLFDFHTISESSQLGPTRRVRDITLDTINSNDWSWADHVRVNSIWDDDMVCSSDERDGIRRIINAEIDVPWFLSEIGLRSSPMNMYAVDMGVPVGLGMAKFIVQVPCSVFYAATDPNSTRGTFNGILEYGHGLFGNRFESRDGYLPPLLNANGYVLVAMDWRGMSQFDLPVVIRVLLSSPSTFRSIRDNLIQGYAAKHSMIHFARNALLDMDWMAFSNRSSSLAPIPKPKETRIVFYGNSQGGILGAGYSIYSHAKQLIDSSILGVPGTPFALILSRSLDFKGYDAVLLLNFYKNRHIRILLSLMQMGWDPVEGAGVLAPPIREYPGPTLLQAGLGDAIVPTIAAEALARAMNASLLPYSPRIPFGLKVITSECSVNMYEDDVCSTPVVLTEIQYIREFESLPTDDFFASPNPVHVCARRDPALQRQISEFLTSGRVLDICADGSCVRKNSSMICS